MPNREVAPEQSRNILGDMAGETVDAMESPRHVGREQNVIEVLLGGALAMREAGYSPEEIYRALLRSIPPKVE